MERIAKFSILLLLLSVVMTVIVADVILSSSRERGYCGTPNLPTQPDILSDTVAYRKAVSLIGRSFESKNGKAHFMKNCTSCHTIGRGAITGPDLNGIFVRIPQPSKDWIFSYVINSQKLINDSNAYALELRKRSGIGKWYHKHSFTEPEMWNLIGFLAIHQTEK